MLELFFGGNVELDCAIESSASPLLQRLQEILALIEVREFAKLLCNIEGFARG